MTIPVFPWAARRMGSLGAACLMASLALGQVPQSDTPTETADPPVLDDFTTRQVVAERPVLPYQPVREADILFEKRIWRVIDVREKMNLPFIYPEAPLFTVLAEAALEGGGDRSRALGRLELDAGACGVAIERCRDLARCTARHGEQRREQYARPPRPVHRDPDHALATLRFCHVTLCRPVTYR
ncbi:MAG TPA: hypothetical protein PKH43_15685 [Saprospiraceae bacterium]|nr:hypothetical protein [Saprospiraceae bacterium]